MSVPGNELDFPDHYSSYINNDYSKKAAEILYHLNGKVDGEYM